MKRKLWIGLSINFLCWSFFMSSMEKPPAPGRHIGNYYFTNHALSQMQIRAINPEAALYVLEHGTRHPIAANRELCVDLATRLVLILNPRRNIIITIYRGATQAKVEQWIETQKNGGVKKKKRYAIDPNKEGELRGRYFYTNIALIRMSERGIDVQSVAWIIQHGSRFNTFSGRQLCIDVASGRAVLFDQHNNVVVSVFKGINQAKLDRWIVSRDAALKEAKKYTLDKSTNDTAADAQSRGLSKKALKYGTLEL